MGGGGNSMAFFTSSSIFFCISSLKVLSSSSVKIPCDIKNDLNLIIGSFDLQKLTSSSDLYRLGSSLVV